MPILSCRSAVAVAFTHTQDYDCNMYGILDTKVEPTLDALAHEPRLIE